MDIVSYTKAKKALEGLKDIQSKLLPDQVQDKVLSDRLSIISVDQATRLNIQKIKGRTVVNHAPLFDSGLWRLGQSEKADVEVLSPARIKMTTTQPWQDYYIHLSLKPSTEYYISGITTVGGRITIREGHDHNGTIIQDYEGSFLSPSDGLICLRLDATTNIGTFYFENISLTEGLEVREFVANMKNLNGFYMKRPGKNLFSAKEFVKMGNNSSIYGISENDGEIVRLGVADNRSWSSVPMFKLRPNTTYTIKIGGNFPIQSNNQLQTNPYHGNGQVTFTTDDQGLQGFKFAAPSTDNVVISDIMLNLGTEPLPFEPQNNDYLYADVELASNHDGSVADVLEYRDGRYWKTKWFEQVMLNGSLDWIYVANQDGYKRISALPDINPVSHTCIVVKYDGKILNTSYTVAGFTQGDEVVLNATFNHKLQITISNSDSGWGDNYTPTADEIKAYFNGWRMYESGNVATSYNRTDGLNKRWAKIYCGVGTAHSSGLVVSGSEVSSVPTTMNDMGYTPYQLQYQLAEPIIEDVTGKVEGSISLHAGDNLVEMGEGVVVRESTIPSNAGGRYFINRSVDGDSSKLTTPALKILTIFRDGEDCTNEWNITRPTTDIAYGVERAEIDEDKFIEGVYTVTYIAEPYTYTAKVQPSNIHIEYSTNIATALDNVIQNVSDLATRVSEIPKIYAKIHQESWIYPELLGGWSSMDNFSYMKMTDGMVTFRGGVNGGGVVNEKDTSMANAIPVCYLPPEYRPHTPVVAIVPCRTGNFASGTWGEIRVHFNPSDGKVAIYEHLDIQSTEYVWFDRIVYYRGFSKL